MPFSPRLGGFDDEPLHGFLTDKQVHSLENWHFVYEGVLVYRAIRSEDSAPTSGTQAQKGSENWRKQLKDADWLLFNALRQWRPSG
ncbi:MAG TPA: hypothetical protein P5069_10180 [Candidatus Hydrogenedentes bacterium]|nr:hypothetical protein [Candidatus Hydrogenedentota bacterium]